MNAIAAIIEAANSLTWPGAFAIAVVAIVVGAVVLFLIDRML